MRLDLKKLQGLDLLKEFNWDLHLIYNNQLLDVCETTNQEKEEIKNIQNYATRCRIDKVQSKHTITIDYILPVKNETLLSKGITQFVTSALIQTITIDVKNSKDELQFTLVCPLSLKCPDWHITFGTKPEVLILTCEYEASNVKIV